MTPAGSVRAGLRAALLQTRSCKLDDRGYVAAAAENLVAAVDEADFREEFERGSGRELASKFLAPHSSSALVVNSFAPFRSRPDDLIMPGLTRTPQLEFEAKCPCGLSRAMPPNLDLLLTTATGVIGVESKLSEYLSPKRAGFSDRYRTELPDELRRGPWFSEMLRLVDAPDVYRHLDAAQLVKHAFGLANCHAEISPRLLYLYWEPADASEHEVFRRHRAEVKDFADRVRGGVPDFVHLTYTDLWKSWSKDGVPWVRHHVAALRARYAIALNSRRGT